MRSIASLAFIQAARIHKVIADVDILIILGSYEVISLSSLASC
jgi:hypothetical protein